MSPDASNNQPQPFSRLQRSYEDWFDLLVRDLLPFEVEDVTIGLHWIAVTVRTPAGRSCGLASTLVDESSGHQGGVLLEDAANLENVPVQRLFAWTHSPKVLQRSIAAAMINAALPRQPERWLDVNAGDFLVELGRHKKVALVGHFPFVENLRQKMETLWVFEKNPHPGDFMAEQAEDLIPQADVVAITGMTQINLTLLELLGLCSPTAQVLLIGPSSPLHAGLGSFGIDWLSGCVIENIDRVVNAVRQGGTFRQISKLGVRLVTMRTDS